MNQKRHNLEGVSQSGSRSLLTKSNFFAFALFALWMIYALNRSFFGVDGISDELFYINEEIEGQSKRKYFLYLAQAFGDFDTAQLMISFINIIAVIISYFILAKINFNEYKATFFHLIYFTAIANYVFRDSLLLLIFVLLTAALFSRKKKYMLMASPLLLLLLDFRPQFLGFFIVSIAAGYGFTKIKSNFLVIVLTIGALGSALTLASLIGESFNIYGITLAEYLQSREERHGQSLTPSSFIISFITHYFAPIPTSLLQRILMGSEFGAIKLSEFGVLDDFYRFIYKAFIYFIILYLLIYWRLMVKVLNRWRFEAGFMISFSLANAMLYSAFAFGGGHERVKIFSTFFLIYLFTAVLHLRKERQLQHVLMVKQG